MQLQQNRNETRSSQALKQLDEGGGGGGSRVWVEVGDRGLGKGGRPDAGHWGHGREKSLCLCLFFVAQFPFFSSHKKLPRRPAGLEQGRCPPFQITRYNKWPVVTVSFSPHFPFLLLPPSYFPSMSALSAAWRNRREGPRLLPM